MNPYLLPFEDFFTYLQQQGFALGVDDFLQVQALLNRLPEDCPPERLKRLLCPLVVSSQEEQKYFYQAFDRYFADMALKEEAIPSRSIESAKQEFLEEEEEDEILKDWSEDTHRQKYGDEMVFTFWGFIANNLKWVVGFVVLMLILLFVGWGASTTPKQSADTYSQTPPSQNEIPHSHNSPYSVEKPYEKPSTFGYWWMFWGMLVVVGGIALYRTFRKEEEGFYLELNTNLKPPKYWNIEVPKSELKFYRSSIFKQVSQQLQKRQKVPTSKIDVPKTLTATIEAAGYPSFHYLQQSELPEYLMLLPQNKASTKDQKLQLFDSWYEALKEQEVFVHRFFYHTDKPEWCTNEEGNVLHIKEVYARFGHCRLLAFVEHPPLSPFKGGIHTKTPPLKGAGEMFGDVGDVFANWEEKALLSINQPSKEAQDWAAQNDLLLMPANLESLTQLNQVFEGEGYAPSFNPMKKSSNKWQGLSTVETVRELKRTLNKTSFKWLCATAMYPEMNWDLTVYIGEALFDERTLTREENVMALVNLPWFRKGTMPEGLRMALMSQLDEHSQYLVRDALLHLLKLNPLVGEEYSAEFFDYQLHIALEDAQLHPEDEHKLSTLKHLTEQALFAESRYQRVVLRYIVEQEKEGGALLNLGKSFANKFKREDIEVEGLLTSKKTEKITYVYPKAHLAGRLASMFVDVIFSVFFLFMAGCCVIILLQHEIVAVIAGGMALWVYLSMDSWTEGSGFGKYAVYRVIDVRTNKPCSVGQSAVRRSFPIILAIVFGIGILMIGYENAGIAAFWVGITYLSLFAFNPHGRKLTDYLADTQVVTEEDYQEGNFKVLNSASKKKAEESDGIYPRANASYRMHAAKVDISLIMVFLIGMSAFGIPIYMLASFSVFGGLGFFLLVIAGVLFCCNLDNWNKGTGLGKTNNLVIVDLETLQLAAKWQKILRRSFDFLPLIFIAGIVHFLGFPFSLFWYCALVIVTVNIGLIYIGKGRRLGDYIINTQVVNREDFERKNSGVRKQTVQYQNNTRTQKYSHLTI